MEPSEIIIKHLQKHNSLEDAHEVRAKVFQEEQSIPSEIDFDDYDSIAEQFVAYIDDKPVGTARYRILPCKIGKVQRVAVLSSQRGKNIGRLLMRAIEDDARHRGMVKLVLDSQVSAEVFYTKLGYVRVGDSFKEADILHIPMALDL